MVAERAVAMRLDRWSREHGMFPDSAPVLLSIGSSGTEDEEDMMDGDMGEGFASTEGGGGGGGEGEGAPRRRGFERMSRVSVGAGEMAADVATADEFRLRLLEAVLGLYSNHPLNYGELETRFHALSFFLCALPYYESRELKGLALKTLEVICVSFKVGGGGGRGGGEWLWWGREGGGGCGGVGEGFWGGGVGLLMSGRGCSGVFFPVRRTFRWPR